MRQYISALFAAIWFWIPTISVQAIPLKAFLTSAPTAASSLPPATSVIAWWALETSGVDSSSNGRNLSVVSSPTHGTGKVSNCFLSSSGSNWYSSSSSAWQSPAGSFSVCAWIRSSDMTPTTQKGIVGKYNTTGTNRVWLLRNETAGNMLFIMSSDGTNVTTSGAGATTLSDNTWYFVCGVFQASTAVTLYVNGVQDATNTTSIPSAVHSSSTQSFGLRTFASDSSRGFIGDVDEVGFFNIALTAGQVSALYNSGNGVTFSALP